MSFVFAPTARNIIAKAREGDSSKKAENLSSTEHGTIMLKRTFQFVGNNLGISHFLLAFLSCSSRVAVLLFSFHISPWPHSRYSFFCVILVVLFHTSSTLLCILLYSGLPNVGYCPVCITQSSNPYQLY